MNSQVMIQTFTLTLEHRMPLLTSSPSWYMQRLKRVYCTDLSGPHFLLETCLVSLSLRELKSTARVCYDMRLSAHSESLSGACARRYIIDWSSTEVRLVHHWELLSHLYLVLRNCRPCLERCSGKCNRGRQQKTYASARQRLRAIMSAECRNIQQVLVTAFSNPFVQDANASFDTTNGSGHLVNSVRVPAKALTCTANWLQACPTFCVSATLWQHQPLFTRLFTDSSS